VRPIRHAARTILEKVCQRLETILPHGFLRFIPSNERNHIVGEYFGIRVRAVHVSTSPASLAWTASAYMVSSFGSNQSLKTSESSSRSNMLMRRSAQTSRHAKGRAISLSYSMPGWWFATPSTSNATRVPLARSKGQSSITRAQLIKSPHHFHCS
jgi:hypothetical protein